jgi:hypothetical protein
MCYRALEKDIKFILLIKSLCCLYLSIFLNVNKKNQFMALLEKNLAQLLKKRLYCAAKLHPLFQQLSDNNAFQTERKISGIP